MHCVDLGESFPNEYLLAKIGVDTAENEPLEVWGKIYSILFNRVLRCDRGAVMAVAQPLPKGVRLLLFGVYLFYETLRKAYSICARIVSARTTTLVSSFASFSYLFLKGAYLHDTSAQKKQKKKQKEKKT